MHLLMDIEIYLTHLKDRIDFTSFLHKQMSRTEAYESIRTKFRQVMFSFKHMTG